MDENELYKKNYGLVKTMAGRYANKFSKAHGSVIEYDDLVQIGGYGLVNAIRTFDESQGWTFGTYASKCILNEIFKEIRRNTRQKNYDENTTLASIQTLVATEEGEVTLEDYLGDYDKNFSSVEDRDIIDKILEIAKRTLNDVEYDLWYRQIQGATVFSLADEQGLNRTTMYMRINSYKKKVLIAVKVHLKIDSANCLN